MRIPHQLVSARGIKYRREGQRIKVKSILFLERGNATIRFQSWDGNGLIPVPLNGINLTDGQRNHRQPGRTLGFSKPSRFDDQRSWISVRWYNFHLKNRSHNNKNSRRSFGSKNSRDDDWNRTSAGFRFHASIHHLFLDGKYRDAKTFQR